MGKNHSSNTLLINKIYIILLKLEVLIKWNIATKRKCGKSWYKKWTAAVNHRKNSAKKRNKISHVKILDAKLSFKAKPIDEQAVNKETKWIKVAVTPESDLIPQSTDKIEVYIGNCRVVVTKNSNKENISSVFEVLAKICEELKRTQRYILHAETLVWGNQ